MSSIIYDSQDSLQDFVNIFKQNDANEAFRVLQSLGGGDQIVKKLLFRKESNINIQQMRDNQVINQKYGPNFQGFQEPSLLNLLKSVLNFEQISLILFGVCIGVFYYLYNYDILVSQIYIFESYIIISIIIPLINQSQNQKKQVQEMNRENYYTIKVLDQGEEKIKYYKELVEGDIIILEPTQQLINVDGLLLQGNINVDESLITGESEIKSKSPYESKNLNIQNNPFIYSGSRILEGKGQMVVLTIGINTQYFKYKINRFLQQEVSKEQTFIGKIKKVSIGFGLVFMVLTFGIEINFDLNEIVKQSYFEMFLIIIITLSMNLTVFPISLKLILNIIKPKIIQYLQNYNITVYSESCLDKIQNINYLISEYTGIFTENCLKVIKVHIGGIQITKVRELKQVSDNLSNHFIKCCYYTTTCIQKQDKYIGDQFECALLKFISKLHYNIQAQRIQDNIIKQYNQFKTVHYNITIVKIVNQYILYVTGNLQTILPRCLQSNVIQSFQNNSDALVMAYKILNSDETNNVPENLLNNLNLISIIELEDPTIANIDDTLTKFSYHNLQLLIVTDQNIKQMKQFASKYLLCSQSSQILTGEELRNTTGGIVRDGNKFSIKFFDEFLKIIHNLRIVTEATSYDRLILNIGIQQMTSHVAVITISQDLANLRLANVGILFNESIQEQGYEPDIQINSNKINDIFKIIEWSSLIRNNTRRIVQFQIPSTISITVGFLLMYNITFINSIIFYNQIIWINLIINGLITFSLNSEPPCNNFEKKFILTANMAKHILFNLVFQLAAILSLSFLSDSFLYLTGGNYVKNIQRMTIIYQTLVLLQIFRSISVKFNFNRKINNLQFFIFVVLALLIQYTMICIYPEYFNFCFLTLQQHLLCLIIGVSYLIILGAICFVVPTKWFNKILKLFQTNVNQHIPQMNKSMSIEMSQSLKEKLLQ